MYIYTEREIGSERYTGLGKLLGVSWGLGRSKIDIKIDLKTHSTSGWIATAKNDSNSMPVMVSALDRGQPASDPATQKNIDSASD